MYIEYTTLREYLNIAADSDDGLLVNVIMQAQSIIETVCKRRFEASSDTTRYFDAEVDVVEGQGYGGRRVLKLDDDLYSVTSITNGDGTTVTAGQYVFNPRNFRPYYEIELKASSTIAWTYSTTPENAIAVTGRWAYSLTPPDDIKWATVRLAAWLYRQRDTSSGDIDRPMLSNSGIVLMPSSLPSDVSKLLERYYRWS